METQTWKKNLSAVAALTFTIVVSTLGYLKIGLPPVIIVGGSGLIGGIFWYFTYLKRPVEPRVILPLFVFTVVGLQIHMIEEYLTSFGPAMSRLFGITWSEQGFVIVFTLVGPMIYMLTTLGLFFRFPLAGFVAWFIFIGPGLAEFSHFIFPLLEPSIQPNSPEPYSEMINGVLIRDMPNYYYKTTGEFYFSGLYTAVLPMIPGGYAIFRLLKHHRNNESNVL
ncbi:hypothetical protein [Leptospira yasudae]|uniref:Uncharacterized protein n=1 Tax=Leptospira yasudae TaxID=2202201 RepID=A0A6N4R072_9LEPT|nr:hypothetical protein [Leptospira yasudae]TGL76421.1 hypothetical protein EHQ77_18700 [Leptospira yasudae]TGL83344.1 hypothetical protein EHQ72_02615 [Leptospira yasudae]TGL89508.1 hypothetical protein EHQ83_01915 [Leptospira yasudae]